jgi:hypothetical protein
MPLSACGFREWPLEVQIGTEFPRHAGMELMCRLATGLRDVVGLERAFDNIGNRASFSPRETMRQVPGAGTP